MREITTRPTLLISKTLNLEFSRGAITAAIVFFVLTLGVVLHRHYSFAASYASFDQGIFNQVFWNGIHGNVFQSSLSSTLSAVVTKDYQLPEVFYHRLGQHFTPALLLWLPLYALFPSPITLFVLQVTLITVAGLVLYNLARLYLSPQLSTLITVSFYTAKAVIGPTLANFSDLCQLPLFMFGLFFALEKRWWWLFGGLAILILAIREDTGVVLFSFGVYLVLSKRYPRLGLLICTLSFVYMLVLTNLVMPLFSEDISRRFMIEEFSHYVTGKRASTLDVIWALVSQPWRLLMELFAHFSSKVNYLFHHWLPLAFVPAISPSAWLLAGFPLLQNLIRRDEMALSSNARYALTLVPGLFYGAILWWSQRYPGIVRQSNTILSESQAASAGLADSHSEFSATSPSKSTRQIPQQTTEDRALKRRFHRFWVVCMGLSLVITFTSNPQRSWSFIVPDHSKPLVYVSLPRQWQHVEQIQSFLQQIPPNASVSATTHIVPHLSSRREILRFPALRLRNDARQEIGVDYVVADFWQLQQYQKAFLDDRNRLHQMVPVVDQVLEQGSYGMIGCKDGVIFMKREASSDPIALSAWRDFRQQLAPILQLPS